MSSCLLINLDEFDTLSPERMQNLKSLITQDVVNERKVYDIQNYTYIRRASFIASTNNPHCMPDVGQNRRILFNTLLDIDYHTPVNHEGIYAQAYALYRQGFQYWYENDEITFLNNRNEAFRQKDPIEENLFFYFRAARPNDIQPQWFPASYLLSVLSLNGRTQSNAQMKRMLVTVLENNHFHSRKKRQQGDRILCGGIYAPRTHGKFNTPAASGSDGVGILTPSPCGMAVFPQIVVFARNNR